MGDKTKFKIGDAVIVTAKDSSEGTHGQVIKVSKSPHFDYRVRLNGGDEWLYTSDELELMKSSEEITPDHPDFQPSDYLTLEDFDAIMKGKEPAPVVSVSGSNLSVEGIYFEWFSEQGQHTEKTLNEAARHIEFLIRRIHKLEGISID